MGRGACRRAIQGSCYVRAVRTEEQPHPKAKQRHHGGDGVEEMHGEEAPVGSIVHVPFGVIMLGIDVEIYHISPRKIPVVAHFASGTVRRGIRHVQRKKDDQKGGHRRSVLLCPAAAALLCRGARCWGMRIGVARGFTWMKDKGEKRSLQPHETSNLESMVWTRERIAHDLIGHD